VDLAVGRRRRRQGSEPTIGLTDDQVRQGRAGRSTEKEPPAVGGAQVAGLVAGEVAIARVELREQALAPGEFG
jgi:hypothetical protein